MLCDVIAAQKQIAGIITETPLRQSLYLSKKTGKNVFLKLENMQASGSFKLRGATNAVLKIPQEKRMHGVITMSAGNHGKAVAFVAEKLGINAVILVSELVPRHKVVAMEKLGAQVIVFGKDQDEATEKALEIAQKKGMSYISAFDDPHVISGQGTVAVEILKENPDIDTMLVQLSGGGLMSGIAVAAKSINPDIKLIGVSIEKGAAMYESIQAGKIVSVEETSSVADALQGGLPFDNRYTFELCRRYVDHITRVPEEQIEKAMAFCFREERLVLEGSGSITTAPLLFDDPILSGKNIAAILSGDNVNVNQLLEIIERHPDPDAY
jgi:threonine dehydratase